MSAGVTGGDFPVCEFADVVATNVKEYVECGNHGRCDSLTGTCECDRGWKGLACTDNQDTADNTFLYAEGPFFAGSLARLRSHRSPSEAFTFLSAEASDGARKIFTVDGLGDVVLHEGSLDVLAGDLRVAQGGLDLPAGGLAAGGAVHAARFAASMPAAAVAGAATGPLLELRGPAAPDAAGGPGPDLDYLWVGPNASTVPRLRVRARGAAELRGGLVMDQGGLVVADRSATSEIAGAAVVGGAVRIDGPEGLALNQGPLVVREAGGLIRSAATTRPVLECVATNAELTAPVLHLAAPRGAGKLFSAAVEGPEGTEPVLEVRRTTQHAHTKTHTPP